MTISRREYFDIQINRYPGEIGLAAYFIDFDDETTTDSTVRADREYSGEDEAPEDGTPCLDALGVPDDGFDLSFLPVSHEEEDEPETMCWLSESVLYFEYWPQLPAPVRAALLRIGSPALHEWVHGE